MEETEHGPKKKEQWKAQRRPKSTSKSPWLPTSPSPPARSFFYFFIFYFRFFIKIYFRFQNLQKYIPAALLPGGRDLVGVFLQKILQKNSWRTGRPTAGRPAPRPPGSGAACPGRLPDTADPHLLHQKFRKQFSVCHNTIRIKDNKKNVPLVCKQWRFSYLQHSELIILTNQRSLVHFEDQRLHQDDRSIITIEEQVATTNQPYRADLSYVVRVRDL